MSANLIILKNIDGVDNQKEKISSYHFTKKPLFGFLVMFMKTIFKGFISIVGLFPSKFNSLPLTVKQFSLLIWFIDNRNSIIITI